MLLQAHHDLSFFSPNPLYIDSNNKQIHHNYQQLPMIQRVIQLHGLLNYKIVNPNIYLYIYSSSNLIIELMNLTDLLLKFDDDLIIKLEMLLSSLLDLLFVILGSFLGLQNTLSHYHPHVLYRPPARHYSIVLPSHSSYTPLTEYQQSSQYPIS